MLSLGQLTEDWTALMLDTYGYQSHVERLSFDVGHVWISLSFLTPPCESGSDDKINLIFAIRTLPLQVFSSFSFMMFLSLHLV